MHRLSVSDLDALARGDYGDGVVDRLWTPQLSRRILLLWALADAAGRALPGSAAGDCAKQSYQVLAAARRADREAADTVLMYPTVGAWAVHCLHLLRRTASCPASLAYDLGHFGAVAAVAGLRAGVAFDLPVSVRQGAVMLPTLGLVQGLSGSDSRWGRVRGTPGTGTVEFLVEDNAVVVSATSDVISATWQPSRFVDLRVGENSVSLAFEDLDPFRDCDAFAVTPPATPAQFARWHTSIDTAWSILSSQHPHRAAAIAAARTRALVPMQPTARAPRASATSHDAPGAVALTPPANPLDLAVTLIHEVQHLILSALLDVAVLHHASDDETYYAPWRSDPRPLVGLLHGAYAFLGVGEFWRERVAIERAGGRPDLAPVASRPSPLREAEFEFAWCRRAVGDTLAVLKESGALTDLGCRFVIGMTERLEHWSGDWVGCDADTAAARSLAALRVSWRLHNLRPREEFVSRWLYAWRAGSHRPAAPLAESAHDVVAGPPGVRDPRAALIRLRAVDPDRFARLREHVGRSPSRPRAGASPRTASPGPTPHTEDGPGRADTLLADGNMDGAAELYRRAVLERPDDISAFAGLTLARGFQHGGTGSGCWQYPELVRAMWYRLQAYDGPAGAPDPDDVADWVEHASDVPDRTRYES